MKNKPLTYLFALAALLIWGIIIYRVVEAASGNAEEIYKKPAVVRKVAYDDYEIPQDTTRLRLNYRDPFGLTKQPDTAKGSVTLITTQPVTRRVEQKPLEFNWDIVHYTGFFSNPSNKKMTTILTISGTAYMLAEGESSSGIRLLKNMGDSVKITLKNKTRFIKRTAAEQ